MVNQYLGGGVAVGDINNDGLTDIYFTSNQGIGALYLNLGNFQFKDITRNAGLVYQEAWTTGTVMADVNGDGFLDIHVSRAGKRPMENTRNLLFINNGDLTFTESASSYGLDDNGLTTNVSFFDMDLDGDLDVYVMNQPIFGEEDPTSFQFEVLQPYDSLSTDRLYENRNGKFVDVTFTSGLLVEKGSGLGITISDMNLDGLPDIFVANDWITNDFLYINQGNGQFEDHCSTLLSKNSFFSMGCDIADVNNDGLNDIYVCDMAPYSHYRRNMIMNGAPQEYYQLQKKYKGVLQHSRNMLHLNSNGTFKEVANMYGIARTDWSWSPLFADFDNDGFKDLFVTNGMKRDLGNMDFEMLMYAEMDNAALNRSRNDLVRNYPVFLLPNKLFRNQPNTRWEDVTEKWGLSDPINAQGSAYADLDLDGDLDLIINPTDSVARIYRNNSYKNNHLSFSVNAQHGNSFGIGTKAWLFVDGTVQFSELSNARGFQSSSEPILHFGLGDHSEVDSVRLIFPSGRSRVLQNIKANQRLTISESDFDPFVNAPMFRASDMSIINESHRIRPPFYHKPSSFFDFARYKTAFRMFSNDGPALAVGDLNCDGNDDFFVGGQCGQTGCIYFQIADGQFYRSIQPDILADSAFSDADAIMIDLNGDNAMDLYVASGGNQYPEGDERYRDRVYLNNGTGSMVKCADCVEDLRQSSGCVAANDIDDDGILELFVGGRVVPGLEGASPKSYLFKNVNGKLVSTSSKIVADLPNLGMVTDAIWYDIDKDGSDELLITREWNSPLVYKRSGNLFKSDSTLIPSLPKGLWSHVSVCDLNQDGENELLFGNWGLNSILTASAEKPLNLHINDFDNDGKQESILSLYLSDTIDSFLGRNEVCAAMPSLWKKYNTYQSFAETPIHQKFGEHYFDSATALQVQSLESVVLVNNRKDGFVKHTLPFESQSAPLKTSYCSNSINACFIAGGTVDLHYSEGSINDLGLQVLTIDGGAEKKIDTKTISIAGDWATSKPICRIEQIMVNQREMMLIGQQGGALLLLQGKHSP